ncbi:pyridoxal-phosphate dependent enzyme [Virgibacillus proomii]|uniref:pyridoxal-phosphate dependent enzyme n=1 Tax=Virgibacillus proomii TaxID=84407 RepID=UPI001C1034AC|nr:pyridoxal-phosphate dependent enzyme [Virgibacillus proomii]MBU5267872.1 pyridoxal-phosphate dependent enzyme [Virgibacillus proomii]
MYQDAFNGNNWLPFEKSLYLGEGNTPIIQFSNDYPLLIKNESLNPTGSHKDRISSYTISMALAKGYKGVVIASSGNAGLSLASYASYAQLPCIVISTYKLNKTIANMIESTGAKLICTNSSFVRWNITKQYVADGFYPATNFLNPPVGSQPIGVQAFKNIARECYAQLNYQIPAKVIVPTSRGDLIWGIFEGFKELKQINLIDHIPKMYAVEPFQRISKVLEGQPYTNIFDGTTELTSINGQTVTFQAIQAVKESNEAAIVVSNQEAQVAQKLASHRGIHLELSSAAAIAASEKIDDTLNEKGSIMAITTSSNFLPV